MSIATEASGRLIRAKNALIQKRAKTKDQAEKDQIDAAISSLNDTQQIIDHLELLDAASAVVKATKTLETVVRSARLGPFDDLFEDAINGITSLLQNGEVGEHLDPAPEVAAAVTEPTGPSSLDRPLPGPATPAGPTTPDRPPTEPPLPTQPPASGGVVAGLPPIGATKKFELLGPEYEAWFAALTIRPENLSQVTFAVNQLIGNKSDYQKAAQATNDKLPWGFVGVIHGMECSFNFAGHLHNGDPLIHRTTHVPKNCPVNGTPPFSWQDSAVDALTLKGFKQETNWSIPRMLYLLEKYNGFGYRFEQLPTPYLWSFSNLYSKGKYVADGVFDPEAVSKQCGAGVMLKALQNRGVSLF
jgi:lysozyme family protein